MDNWQSPIYDHCDVCDDRIVREVMMAITDAAPYWLGRCSCPERKFRWRSATGETPWELIG